MAVLVYSVVRRHMKMTSPGAFTVFDGASELPATLQLARNEAVIGWYRNPRPWQASAIIFTSEAFHLVEGERIKRLPLEEIVGYELPKSKADATGVRVLTKNGFRFVRVAGRFGPNGNRKDAYSFIMVLRALVPRPPTLPQDGSMPGPDR